MLKHLDIFHHIFYARKSSKEINDDGGKPQPNPDYHKSVNKDWLLTSWLLATMTKETLSLFLGTNTTF